MKLSSSWPSGRMLADSESGATWCANLSAELSGGSVDVLVDDPSDSVVGNCSLTATTSFMRSDSTFTSSSSASSTDEISDAKSIRDCCCCGLGRALSSSKTTAGARSIKGANELTLDPLDIPAAFAVGTWVSTAVEVTVSRSSRTYPAAANADLTDSLTASATAAERRKRTSVFAGCTL